MIRTKIMITIPITKNNEISVSDSSFHLSGSSGYLSSKNQRSAKIDFTGTSEQVSGNFNAPASVLYRRLITLSLSPYVSFTLSTVRSCRIFPSRWF